MNNHKKILFSGLIFFLFFVGQFALKNSFASAENGNKTLFFNKDMRIGDKNEDVRALQKFLNKNPSTKVSSFGVGSSGNESDFFGTLTKNAVIKFQELYESDILKPFGLKSGTGFVGTATRLKLNSLIRKDSENTVSVSVKNNSSQAKSSFSSRSYKVVTNSKQDEESAVGSSSSANSSFFGEETVSVRVYNTSEYQVSPGDAVILTGYGFTKSSNTIYFGESHSISDLTSNDEGSEMSFNIPKDLPLGKYSIWVTNASGTSKSETIKIYIVVTDNPAERPVVEKVEPAEATIDSEITVSGKGFTSSGNNIYSMFGNVLNLNSSDGKTIKFNASALSQLTKLKNDKSAKNTQAEVWFYVVNDNGYNKEPASFLIKF